MTPLKKLLRWRSCDVLGSELLWNYRRPVSNITWLMRLDPLSCNYVQISALPGRATHSFTSKPPFWPGPVLGQLMFGSPQLCRRQQQNTEPDRTTRSAFSSNFDEHAGGNRRAVFREKSDFLELQNQHTLVLLEQNGPRNTQRFSERTS